MAKEFSAASITEDLKRTGLCNIPGVAKISVVDRPARTGRNPATGESMQIAAKKAIKISISKTLKDAINA